MFRNKLNALEYEGRGDFDANDEASFRKLVSWLEDRKVRNYKKEERGPIRDINSQNWDATFRDYLDNLACPVDHGDRLAVVDWLLGYAVRLEYSDGLDDFNKETSETKPQESKHVAPKIVSSSPLDNLDFQHPDFVKGVEALAKTLNISCHPDHLVTLKACSRLVQERLTGLGVSGSPAFVVPTGQPFPIQEGDLGFDTGDYVLNQAAKILRLLFVHDIRSLQTRINEIIVTAQKVTANPKTDTRLGKVGI